MRPTQLITAIAMLGALVAAPAEAQERRRHPGNGNRSEQSGDRGSRRAAPRAVQRAPEARRQYDAPRQNTRQRRADVPRRSGVQRRAAPPRRYDGPRSDVRRDAGRRYETPRSDTRRFDDRRYDSRRSYDVRRYDNRRSYDVRRYDNRRSYDSRRGYDYGRYAVPRHPYYGSSRYQRPYYRWYGNRYGSRVILAPRFISPRIVTVIPYRPYYYRPRISIGVYYGHGDLYPYGYTPSGYYDPAPGVAYGGVRIVDAPRDAQVFADGYYVGIVDDFDGIFQHLNLEAGEHRIEIVTPGGYQSVAFDVLVQPGRTITYRADLY